MEAFMLSLGRRSELDLSALASKLTDADVSAGLAVFKDPTKGKCAFCHFNAGANQGIFPPFGKGNANFNTGVETAAASAGLHSALRPVDGGFGKAGTLAAGFGNGTFNTPSLVEAADKKTFFHNNLCTTIECAVEFYNSDAFIDSPSGAIAPISLGHDEVFQVAAFLRVINALENIRSAEEKLTSALHGLGLPEIDKRLRLARGDIKDAHRVLEQALPALTSNGVHPIARAYLGNAGHFCETAQATKSKVARDFEINAALSALAQAKGDIVGP